MNAFNEFKNLELKLYSLEKLSHSIYITLKNEEVAKYVIVNQLNVDSLAHIYTPFCFV